MACVTTCSTSPRRGSSGPIRTRKNFAIDKNNFGPRAGVSWSVDNSAHTVVRASIGLMYEPPLLDFYDNAILNNGDPKSYNVGPVLPTAAGAPAFPGNLVDAAAGIRVAETEHQRGRSRTSRRSRRG